MPSAANVKIDKQISPENALAEPSGTNNSNLTPLKQGITIIEHKIRNLEKRKSKLESYRDLQNAGKELNSDQKTALAKINEVIQTLDFARDLHKQFLGIALSAEKDAKKQAKREEAQKKQTELARLREILLVQDALNQMGNENVRDDFLNARNGAAQLSEPDLKLLDDLYPAVTPKHEAGNPTVFTNEVQAAAEHLLAVVDGKPKEVFGGTYSQVKEILGKIHESGYFDQAEAVEVAVERETIEVVQETIIDTQEVIPPEVTQDAIATPIETITIEATNHPALHGQQPLVGEGLLSQQAPVTVEPNVPVIPQIPAQEIFYQQAPPTLPQSAQPLRPITEMLGTGSFFFLQESEIDTPDQIPSQTFTNQSFVVQPPPPIPMPPHFQPPSQPLPPTNLPTTMNHQPVQVSGAPPTDDTSIIKPLAQPIDDLQKHSSTGPGVTNQPQPFYNNGYGNRSKPQQQSRNNGIGGTHPRPQTTRH
ncbi:caprin-1-like [Cylas formicarius]|uniref:caprin-1-like n=1 Tax=Cylas formicarius TaxID=197179 RepID=UPI0029585679|nr:caprin-1-like [Cylas formicarius]